MSSAGFFKVDDGIMMPICAARTEAETASLLNQSLIEILNSIDVKPSLELLLAVTGALDCQLGEVISSLITAEENTRSGK